MSDPRAEAKTLLEAHRGAYPSAAYTLLEWYESTLTAQEQRERELREALRVIQSQCAGHCDEFSLRVWQVADKAIAKSEGR